MVTDWSTAAHRSYNTWHDTELHIPFVKRNGSPRIFQWFKETSMARGLWKTLPQALHQFKGRCGSRGPALRKGRGEMTKPTTQSIVASGQGQAVPKPSERKRDTKRACRCVWLQQNTKATQWKIQHFIQFQCPYYFWHYLNFVVILLCLI